jgi:phosphoribosylaminoimidazolecarboxamide formyltransferase/IMP cyclohydrolase
MKKIKTALISVSDKKNLKPLLNSLKKNNIKIISSGGTYKEIKKLKFKCIEVSEFTNSPEILEGRVKTLHPKIHAGILNKRKNKTHLRDIKNNNFEKHRFSYCKFLSLRRDIKNTKNHEKIIENIDVGGPTMVRAAAKNYKDVTVITSSDQYRELIEELKLYKGSTSLEFREKLSRIAFTETAYYDSVISNYFNKRNNVIFPNKKCFMQIL